jgi:Predicted transcriptional regulator
MWGDRLQFKRIQDLREDKDMSIKDISNELELHRDVYSRYEKGKRDFPIDVLIKLANLWDCSIDYLVERTDKKEVNK